MAHLDRSGLGALHLDYVETERRVDRQGIRAWLELKRGVLKLPYQSLSPPHPPKVSSLLLGTDVIGMSLSESGEVLAIQQTCTQRVSMDECTSESRTVRFRGNHDLPERNSRWPDRMLRPSAFECIPHLGLSRWKRPQLAHLAKLLEQRTAEQITPLLLGPIQPIVVQRSEARYLQVSLEVSLRAEGIPDPLNGLVHNTSNVFISDYHRGVAFCRLHQQFIVDYAFEQLTPERNKPLGVGRYNPTLSPERLDLLIDP
jgi:hypothetical protein